MNLTIDANIWVSHYDYNDKACHNICSDFLYKVFQRNNIILHSPYILTVEVAATFARKMRSINPKECPLATAKGNIIAGEVINFQNGHTWHVLDKQLSYESQTCATNAFLKGADSIYVAVAQKSGSILITNDEEIKDRASKLVTVMTPQEWLKKYSVPQT